MNIAKAMLVVWRHETLRLRQIKKRRKVASFYVAEVYEQEPKKRFVNMPEAYLSMGGMLAFQKGHRLPFEWTLQKAMLVVWTHDALHLRQIKKRRKVASFYVAEIYK